LEEMRKADACAAKYGSPDEKEIVESSLAHLEEEIDSGDDDSTKIIGFLILLALAAKRSRVSYSQFISPHETLLPPSLSKTFSAETDRGYLACWPKP